MQEWILPDGSNADNTDSDSPFETHKVPDPGTLPPPDEEHLKSFALEELIIKTHKIPDPGTLALPDEEYLAGFEYLFEAPKVPDPDVGPFPEPHWPSPGPDKRPLKEVVDLPDPGHLPPPDERPV